MCDWWNAQLGGSQYVSCTGLCVAPMCRNILKYTYIHIYIACIMTSVWYICVYAFLQCCIVITSVSTNGERIAREPVHEKVNSGASRLVRSVAYNLVVFYQYVWACVHVCLNILNSPLANVHWYILCHNVINTLFLMFPFSFRSAIDRISDVVAACEESLLGIRKVNIVNRNTIVCKH